MSVNLKPSFSTEASDHGDGGLKTTVDQNVSLRSDDQKRSKRFGADVIDVADHFMRREGFVELIGRADVAAEQFSGRLSSEWRGRQGRQVQQVRAAGFHSSDRISGKEFRRQNSKPEIQNSEWGLLSRGSTRLKPGSQGGAHFSGPLQHRHVAAIGDDHQRGCRRIFAAMAACWAGVLQPSSRPVSSNAGTAYLIQDRGGVRPGEKRAHLGGENFGSFARHHCDDRVPPGPCHGCGANRSSAATIRAASHACLRDCASATSSPRLRVSSSPAAPAGSGK